jgi:hypothetical protein
MKHKVLLHYKGTVFYNKRDFASMEINCLMCVCGGGGGFAGWKHDNDAWGHEQQP